MSEPVKSLPSPTSSGGQPAGSDTYKGWLYKWTNYLKGYQRRWFVLSNGLLSYYSGGRNYHLKATSDGESQRWVSALQQAKANTTHMMHQSDDSGDEAPVPHPDRALTQGALKNLASKLDDLSTCNELIGKHGTALQRSLSELEDLRTATDGTDKLKTVNERATLFRITSNAMINACRDFLDVAETHSRKWQRALQYEREQRHHLEETIEQLAKQHNSLERAWREAPSTHPDGGERTQEGDENEDTEFFDAMEDSPAFITVTATDHTQHRRSGSNQSIMSGGLPNNEWSHDEKDAGSNNMQLRRVRRSRIPDKPNYSLNLWSIMKNCIGKELSKIPMPRLTEDLEYSDLLDRAARCESSLEQMCLVAAFSVSSYSTTIHRTAKPFNPLLGETYELDRLDDFGYRSICEQRGWTLWQEITIDSKFRGKYISVMPLVTSTVHNIIVGKLWIDQSGDIEIVNHRTKDTCHLKFVPYSYFSRDLPRKVTGVVADSEGTAHHILSGTWDEKMESAKIVESSRGCGGSEGKQKTVYQTLQPKLLWKKYPLPENAENMHFFSSLALTLNEPEEGVAPTDSRLRPDQRLMEAGLWDEANVHKQRLEERQRLERRKREAQATQALEEGQDFEGFQPLWFERRTDDSTGESTYVYRGGYWESKDRQDWSQCPDIF
ncbi:unnamed protein product [Coregonus sp. 'balchen']|nr:unnamed protein product [Coregonus sp. 'balchen']